MALKLPATLRTDRRYIVLNSTDKDAIERLIVNYLGILGWAKCSPVFVESDLKENITILSINRKELDSVRAAIEMANGEIRILRVSGTIKGTKTKV